MHKCSFSDPASRSTEKESVAKKTLHIQRRCLQGNKSLKLFARSHLAPPGTSLSCPVSSSLPLFYHNQQNKKNNASCLVCMCLPCFSHVTKKTLRECETALISQYGTLSFQSWSWSTCVNKCLELLSVFKFLLCVAKGEKNIQCVPYFISLFSFIKEKKKKR